MKTYSVNAINSKGVEIKETISAESPQQLTDIIKGRNLYLIEYKEYVSSTSSVVKLKLKSLVIFCRQLSTMIGAGIPIVQALDMVQSKADDMKSKKIYSNIYEEVQKGNALSAAMKAQDGAFPELLINMVEAGELGGTLDNSLLQMSTYFEKENKLNNKIKAASVYPMILGIISVAVVLLLVTFVLPTITGMFDAALMPWPTKILMGISNFLIDNWLLILLVVGLVVIGWSMLLKVDIVRYNFDKLKLDVPVVGKLMRTVYSARAARAMASLNSSGIQPLDMIETTGKVLGNKYLEAQFMDILLEVSKGGLISEAIASTNSFDPMLSSMIFIGEESGALETILSNTADYFDEESDAATTKLVSMLEPIMIIVLGFAIGFIVVAIIMPMFSMYSAAGQA